MLRAVELAGDQAPIPRQNRLGFGDTSDLRQMFPAQTLGDLCQGSALGIGEPQPTGEVGAENSILRDQVFAL